MGFSTLSPLPMHEGQLASCDNCDWQGRAADCEPIRDPSERLNAGSEVPAGECPLCNCLAYVVQEDDEVRQGWLWPWLSKWPGEAWL